MKSYSHLMAFVICVAVTTTAAAVEPSEIVYKRVGDRELKLHMSYPPDWIATDQRPFVVFFFGGGWNNGSVDQFEEQAAAFAERGLVVARADYRVKSKDGVSPDACVSDARSAVRFMKSNADKLGIDPDKFISAGGSAGGHLAATMIIDESIETDSDDLSISTRPAAMVLYNPVLDFLEESLLKRVGGDQEIARRISPVAHLSEATPPTLLMYGTDDKLKVHGARFKKRASSVGVRVEEYFADGEKHGFFNKEPWKRQTTSAAGNFLASLGFVAVQETRPNREGRVSDRIPQQQSRADAGGQAVANLVKQWLQRDTNKDGKITIDETEGLMKSNFDRNDLNQDGAIDQQEMKTLAQRLVRSRTGNQNPNLRNRQRNVQSSVSNAKLRSMAPQGVEVVPDIAYREGNPEWKLDLAMPAEKGDQPRPAIVFIHGGGWRNGDKRAGAFLNPMLDYATRGYVCVSINYRLLRDGSTDISMCVEDVKCAVRWLRAHAEKYNVDPMRIGATGNSAGAHLSVMLALCPTSAGMEGDGPYQDYSSMVQAVCASATPASFMIPMSKRAASQFSSDIDDAELRRRQNISPIHWVTKEAPPMLLVHEVSDATVSVKQSDELVAALKKVGAADVEYQRFEDGSGHGVFQHNIATTEPARARFFERTLMNADSVK